MKNRRRIAASTDAKGAGTSEQLTMDFDESDVVNLHGFRAEAVLEPETENANANGTWAIYVLPGDIIQAADLPANIGQLNATDAAAYLWGAGVWAAANQTTDKIKFEPKTSRNIPNKGRVVFRVTFDGVSAGNVRINQLMTGFTTS